jgi:hypothetical protein
MDKERRPEAINTVYVARFLIRTLGVEQKTANTMTQDIWLRLMRCVPEAFSYKTCKRSEASVAAPNMGVALQATGSTGVTLNRGPAWFRSCWMPTQLSSRL